MKQIVDKLNKIAKAIDENTTIPKRKLIIDSLDAITKALQGTIVNSHLIVDKLDRIAKAVKDYHGGGGEEYEYKEVAINLVDNAGSQLPYVIFDAEVMGGVVPNGDTHIHTPVPLFYVNDGGTVTPLDYDTMRVVNYRNTSPLMPARYFGRLVVYDAGDSEVTITGNHCTVNRLSTEPYTEYDIVITPSAEDISITITLDVEGEK